MSRSNWIDAPRDATLGTGITLPCPRSPTIRILFVSDSIREPLTGVGRIALTWMRELVELGVDVVAVDHEDNPLARSVCGECRVLAGPGAMMRMGRWHLTLLRRVPALGIDHDVLFDPTGYPNAFGHHPRLVVMVHDLSMFEPGLYRRGKRLWFRLFYCRGLRKARLCICVSKHTRRQLLARFDLDPTRCIVVPNSLDPRLSGYPTGAPHGDTPTTPYFLTVGTIERRKNTHRLLDAFAAADVPHRLVLAGRRGHGSAELLARITELGERVVLLHDISDQELLHLYRGATALLFPSLDEGFGLPILEAMQCRVPVLTSTTTAMPEVAGDAALLVDPRNTTAIRAGIVRLAADAALREELVVKGCRRLALFDARRNAKHLIAQLREL